jgi:beta-phosphoglucomutase-like phosphatase (HAD superfamily)
MVDADFSLWIVFGVVAVGAIAFSLGAFLHRRLPTLDEYRRGQHSLKSYEDQLREYDEQNRRVNRQLDRAEANLNREDAHFARQEALLERIERLLEGLDGKRAPNVTADASHDPRIREI